MKITIALFLVFIFTLTARPQSPKDLATAAERAEKSTKIIKEFAALGANALPVRLLQKAKAVVVFPALTRVNILLNELTMGNGIAVLRSENDGALSTPFFMALKAQDVNLRLAGKKSYAVVLLLMNDRSVEWLKKGDIYLAAGSKRKIALGPVVEGKGATEIMQSADVIYYAMNEGQLIDSTLSNDSVFKAVSILHDNNMSKAVFGLRNKQLLAADEATLKVPVEIADFRGALKEILASRKTESDDQKTAAVQ